MARSKEFEINEVLDKAIQLFWMQGYEKTSMQDLVDCMGIHRRSIYDTFGDKHALYLTALQRYESTQNKKMRFLVEKQEPVKEIIRQFLESSMRSEGEPQGCFIVNSGVELGVLDPEVASFVENSYSKTEKLLYDLVQTGQQRGELRISLEPEAISHYLMNAWLGLRTMVKTATDHKKLTSIIHTILITLD
ncbi:MULTISPECIES: TetR/AcrR family transcriptional regulator [Paenibacillus]|uniref:TetR/AcrR family transcriptional regulator n=1 Tax=Paenibacillus TaxID=44249 RepID=UPI00096EB56F|nr:TetR/AcrR family transcriptional regulator [Paenibacillus odorifer]MEC0134177.1 TetR/AcrR family transcriptional regulator [Paenibacillus odorifer]MEC0222538.1 TetR/AcrR family transcriptional regulator [Paenibacillus odorifer]OMD15130.1 TetR family transcriptional regulator [Paenibacillus odorifer]OMD16050.1 TetR family transcriptional regulator [Paenibacillus odorifer]OMD28467.1 TetR family transcriptional regulator [Paenibacillus odorifer]